jgi:hypothetical protein
MRAHTPRVGWISFAVLCFLFLCPVSQPAWAAADTWRYVAPMPVARAYSPVVAVDGQLYAFTDGIHPATHRYDPATDTWSQLAPSPSSRAYFVAAVVDRKIYLIGGCFSSDCRIGVTNLVEIYDIATNSWSIGPAMPTPRWGSAVGVIGGKIYVAAGGSPCPFCFPQHNVLEVFDPATNLWTTKAPLPTRREEVASVVLDGKLHVISGFERTAGSWSTWLSPGTDSNSVDIYDPAADTWSAGVALPGTGGFTAAAVVQGHIHVVGRRQTQSSIVDMSHLVFDPALGAWSAKAPMNALRSGHALAAIGSKLYAIGGTTGVRVTTVEEYSAEPADVIPPVTVATISPAANAAGWHRANVAVSLAASDPGGSGVASITYTTTNGATSTSVTVGGANASLQITMEGTTVVTFAAKDAAGNVETLKSLSVRLDKTAPSMSLPAAFSVDATSPAGAVVHYSAQARDNLDPAPSLSCFPSSGSTFPIAISNVTCTAADAAGNSSTGSFLVTVVGAEGQIIALIARVEAAGLSPPLTIALVTELKVALFKLRIGYGQVACLAMKVFTETVRVAGAKGQLPSVHVTDFTQRGERIRAVMACS